MNNVFEREDGLASIAAHLSAVRLVSNAERRVDLVRQIVAQGRDFVAEFEGQNPIAVALLENFESSLALFEENLAAHQYNEALIARSEQAVRSSKALLAQTPNCLEPADAIGPKVYQAKLRAVAHIMEILREGGYHCELAQETLH